MTDPSVPTPGRAVAGDATHDDFGGLDRDRSALLGRRRALRWMGGIGLAGLLAACSSDDATSPASTTPTSTTPGSSGSSTNPSTTAATTTAEGATVEASAGAEIPDETAGPYPADGSNGPNVLGTEELTRSDLTTSFGDLSGTAEGIPATIRLTIVEAGTGDPIPGAAVYLWHCTAGGRYSIYEVTDQNYLRGIQEADGGGRVAFTSVFPGCYPGRWPHCHFEVYESLDQASTGTAARKTSQLALPQADCEVAYTDGRYGDSLSDLGRLSLSTDNVFRDGWEDQLATVAGSPDDGYTVSLLVRV